MKKNVVSWAALVVSTAALLSSHHLTRPVPAAPQITPESQKTARALSDAYVAVAEFVQPSVVQVAVEKKVKMPAMGGMRMMPRNGQPNRGNGNGEGNVDPQQLEEMFRRFFGPDGMPGPGNGFEPQGQPRSQVQRGMGSGFVYDDHGHILTNNHVVEGADKIIVTFHDGEEAAATVVGTDPKTDVAVIQVKNARYRALPKGQSSKVKVGELVMAVGSPFELEQTVTTGIVSALGRNDVHILGKNGFEDFIQTDAAVNPGNSGGPLVDMDGRVVGINTAIATGGGRGSAGVGFAIPIDMAANIADRLIKEGKVNRVALGIGLEPLTPNLARSFGYDPKMKGVVVGQVFPDSPAAKAGLRRGDVIVKFDETPASNVSAFRSFVATSEAGRKHQLVFLRDGETKTADVSLAPAEKVLTQLDDRDQEAQPERQPAREAEAKVAVNGFGLEVQALTPELAESLGFAKDAKGVLIANVKEDGPAANAGLRKGMLITTYVQDKKVRNVESTKQFQELTARTKRLTLYIQLPEGAGKFVTLAQPEDEKP
jgi:serine protease Do